MISQATAYRALAAVLPHTNPPGGSGRAVREAVGVIETHTTIDGLIDTSARARKVGSRTAPPSPLTRLPTPLSLAVGMVVHENVLRRTAPPAPPAWLTRVSIFADCGSVCCTHSSFPVGLAKSRPAVPNRAARGSGRCSKAARKGGVGKNRLVRV